MWAAMREQEGTRRARSQFMALVDQTDRPGEAGRRAALRERGAELLGAGGLSYEERVGIASGSMVEGEEAARAGYAASGYRAGAVDIQTVRERFLTLRRQQTGSAGGLGEQLEMTAFDWTAYWNANDPEATARQMGGGRFVGPNAGQRNQQFVNQLLGREPMPAFNIRLTGPDGRDVPHEIEALGIQGR
jgi:hypothetical protein